MRTLIENPVNTEVDDDSVDFSSQEASNFELSNDYQTQKIDALLVFSHHTFLLEDY